MRLQQPIENQTVYFNFNGRWYFAPKIHEARKFLSYWEPDTGNDALLFNGGPVATVLGGWSPQTIEKFAGQNHIGK